MRSLLVTISLLVGLTLGLTVSPAAVAAVDGGGLPVDAYANYEPQST